MDKPKYRLPRGISLTCKAIPSPPGTKSRAKLPRCWEDELAIIRRKQLIVAGLMAASLVVGIVIGRWLLP